MPGRRFEAKFVDCFAVRPVAVMLCHAAGSPPLGNIQPLGGDDGNVARKTMEEAGFVDVKVSKVNIPMYASAGTGYGELFAYGTGPTPAEVRFLIQ